jgi:uncharacterized protein
MQRRCPNCGSFSVRRSRTDEDDDDARRSFQARYRCRSCRSLFWAVSTEGLRLAIAAGILAALCVLAIGTLVVFNFIGEPHEVASPGNAQTQAAVGKPGSDAFDADRASSGPDRARDADALNDADRMASLERAAEEGDLDAQYALGMTLLSGQWGAQGNKHAAVWLQRAAERGHGLAQLQLGRLYRSGVGVPEDHAKAYLWLNLAAAQGVHGADMARDAVAALLTNAEISKARAESLRIGEQQRRPSAPVR